MEQLVNFFVVGVQKGGTRALSSYLRFHPNIQMSRGIELHYFDNEQIDWAAPARDHLHDQFDWSVSGVLRGEVTPIYLYWPDALKRLHDYNPKARLIVLLRHPVHRAFSHWRMETGRGLEELTFEEAIQIGRERVRTAPNGAHRVFSYVERGFYSQQLERLFTLFPRSQVYFLRTDEFWLNPDAALAGIEGFIGLEPRKLLRCTQDLRTQTSTLSEQARILLLEQYASDIIETSRLTGLDLGDWLSDAYREPMYSTEQE